MEDPWEPLTGRPAPHVPVLTSVEISVTGLCNLRCVYCAVGEQLAVREPARIPVADLIGALDRVPDLATLSITGGEPVASRAAAEGWVAPLLRYARGRGVATQVNTNLTYGLERYLPLEGLVDVLHISWNWADAAHFSHAARVAPGAADALYRRILDNAGALAARGWFISAETMMAPETLPHLGAFNHTLAAAGCRRHEVHPRYPVDWAAALPVLDLETMAAGIRRFLAERDPDLWVLFGTFPFVPCSPDPEHRALWQQAVAAPHVTIRNDPDGRNRINVDALSGAIRVTDFADLPPLGNLRDGDSLAGCFAAWQDHPAYQPFRCCCPAAACLGPNIIVAHTWFAGVDFRARRALVGVPVPS